MALSEGAGGGDEDVGDVIYASFGRRVQISREEWIAGATRCEREADRQTEEIARTLRRCAASYRRRADGV
jgi:hypothetical protein